MLHQRESTFWTAGWQIRNPEILSERESKKTAPNGLFRDISDRTWKDEQYYRTREMEYVRPAFEDLLKRLQTDYIDLGMIHYVDSEEEWEISSIRNIWIT